MVETKMLQAGFFLGLFINPEDPEDRVDMFVLNNGWLSKDFMVLYPI
jgi:hypothetical protein